MRINGRYERKVLICIILLILVTLIHYLRKAAIPNAEIYNKKIVINGFNSSKIIIIEINPNKNSRFLMVSPIHLTENEMNNEVLITYYSKVVEGVYSKIKKKSEITLLLYLTFEKIYKNIFDDFLENLRVKGIKYTIKHPRKKSSFEKYYDFDNLGITEDCVFYIKNENRNLAQALDYISQFSSYSLYPKSGNFTYGPKYEDEKYFYPFEIMYNIPTDDIFKNMINAVGYFKEPSQRTYSKSEFMLVNINIDSGCHEIEETKFMCRLWNLARAEQISRFLYTTGEDAPLKMLTELYNSYIHSGLMVNYGKDTNSFINPPILDHTIKGRVLGNIKITYGIFENENGIKKDIIEESTLKLKYVFIKGVIIKSEPKKIPIISIYFNSKVFISKAFFKWGSSLECKCQYTITYNIIGDKTMKCSQVGANGEHKLDINQKVSEIHIQNKESLKFLYISEIIILLT